MNYQVEVRGRGDAPRGGCIALAIAAMVCATALAVAWIARDRTLTVRFEIDGKGVAQCTGR